MSSCMVHLLAAREYRPDASPLFYAANLAPDCIDIREIKDKGDASRFRKAGRGLFASVR